MIVRKAVLLLAILATGCRAGPTLTSGTAPPVLTVHSIALPGAPAGGVAMDYLAYDRVHHRV